MTKALFSVVPPAELAAVLQAFNRCAGSCAFVSVEAGHLFLTLLPLSVPFPSSAEQTYDDMIDSAAGGCLCCAGSGPDVSEHPIWGEVQAYNHHYSSRSLHFEALPSDRPSHVMITGGTRGRRALIVWQACTSWPPHVPEPLGSRA